MCLAWWANEETVKGRETSLPQVWTSPWFQCVPPSFCFYLVRSARLSLVLCLCLPVLTVLSLCFLSWSHTHTYTYTHTNVSVLLFHTFWSSSSLFRDWGGKSGASTGRPSRRLAASKALAELVHEIRMKSRRYVARWSLQPINAQISAKDGSG